MGSVCLAIPVLTVVVADLQEYIIYVNEKPFDLSAFEAQFNSAYSERARPSEEKS